MKNVYHILHEYPHLEWYEMTKETEELSRALVSSGLLRLDARLSSNFVRFAIPASGINLAFSDRQLLDPHLTERTKAIISSCLSYAGYGRNPEKQLEIEWERLHYLLRQNIPVLPDRELKLARLLVQSSHPIISHLILQEQVEVFISYGFEIGDVMDVQTWQSSGQNSGMQSTDGVNSAIYVSCGGNPFILNEEQKTYLSDGFQAMARFLVIAGQEMGHYADIIRNHKGRKVSRHSADLGGNRAKEHVRLGRLADIQQLDHMYQNMRSFGLKILVAIEKDYLHYKKFKVGGLRMLKTKIKMRLARMYFLSRCKSSGYDFVKYLRSEACIGNQLHIYYEDMHFNLTPKADVYARDDPLAEEAIACVEALARVPQQVNKWGHKPTAFAMQELYKVYYNEVIPAGIETYEHLSGKKYQPKSRKLHKPLWLTIKHLFKKPPEKELAPLYID